MPSSANSGLESCWADGPSFRLLGIPPFARYAKNGHPQCLGGGRFQIIERWATRPMSVVLFVTQTRPIDLKEVASEVGEAFQRLLSLSQKPIIIAIFDAADRQGDPSLPNLSPGSCRVLCSIEGYPEQVAVTPLVIPDGTLGELGQWSFVDRDFISIRWQMHKSPLCFALQAAAAFALAKWMNSTIEDNAGFFTVSNDSAPAEFAEAVRLPQMQTEIRSAAEEFFNRLPMGGFSDSGQVVLQ
jgi:hypothetical protein